MKPQDRTRAILRSKLDPVARFVLVAIADHLGADDGEAWPSMPRLAGLTGYDARSVRRAVARMEAGGLIATDRQLGRAIRYQVAWAALASHDPGQRVPPGMSAPRTESPPTPDRESPLGGTESPPTPDRESPEVDQGRDQVKVSREATIISSGSSEDDDDPPRGSRVLASTSRAEAPPRQPSIPGLPADAAASRDHAAELYALYRRYHPRCPAALTPKRRPLVRTILAECGSPEAAARYLRWVHEADSRYAQQLRGAAPWPDGRLRAYLALEELARHVDRRMAEAAAWTPPAALDPEIAAALRLARTVLASTHPLMRAVYDEADPLRDHRIRAAVLAAGGRKAFDGAPRLGDAQLAAFIAAYYQESAA